MDFNKWFCDKRTGKENINTHPDPRTEYQRDFDRIIFSSAFRRLQNKTQVFPLPGSVFVHNRLTHSLEVASVGRSLGSLVGNYLIDTYKSDIDEKVQNNFRYSLYNVIASAALCHDIGNPAFGHSGEDAIANFFIRNKGNLESKFSPEQWQDFLNFEGNANAIRVLTHQQPGKSEGGLKLTYTTLASIAKYPCESQAIDKTKDKSKKRLNRKKFGFFTSEKRTFLDIAANTGMKQEIGEFISFKRHPFVWLVEAADDICYSIIDLEDGHRLGIIDSETYSKYMLDLIDNLQVDSITNVRSQLGKLKDRNDRASYLRAKAINSLTISAVNQFKDNCEFFLDGSQNKSLFNLIKDNCPVINEIEGFSQDHIYNHRSVVEIENAGYNVMYELLQHFIPPILLEPDNRSSSEKKALKLLPNQFLYENSEAYFRVLGVLDYVSGMTDNYATDLYRKIKGIDIGMTI